MDLKLVKKRVKCKIDKSIIHNIVYCLKQFNNFPMLQLPIYCLNENEIASAFQQFYRQLIKLIYLLFIDWNKLKLICIYGA